MIHWLAYHAGLTNASGAWYLWWSGIVGDIALVGASWAVLRKLNCEVHGCPRIGRHDSAAGHHLCRKHHPDTHLSAQDALDAHNEVKADT